MSTDNISIYRTSRGSINWITARWPVSPNDRIARKCMEQIAISKGCCSAIHDNVAPCTFICLMHRIRFTNVFHIKASPIFLSALFLAGFPFIVALSYSLSSFLSSFSLAFFQRRFFSPWLPVGYFLNFKLFVGLIHVIIHIYISFFHHI